MITIDTDGIDRDSVCGAVIMESPAGSGNSNDPGNVFLGLSTRFVLNYYSREFHLTSGEF